MNGRMRTHLTQGLGAIFDQFSAAIYNEEKNYELGKKL